MSAAAPMHPSRRARLAREAAMLAMAQRPEGVDIAEAAAALGLSRKVACVGLARLIKSGQIFSARPRMQCQRYFAAAALAARWLEQQQPRRWQIDLPGTPDAPEKVRRRKVGGQIIGVADHSRAVLTACPSPAVGSTRFLVDPASRPYGAGFAAAGIGRDVTTGKPWR